MEQSGTTCVVGEQFFFFFSSRRRHTRFDCDWSSDVCSSDLNTLYSIGYLKKLNSFMNLITLYILNKLSKNIIVVFVWSYFDCKTKIDEMYIEIGRASCRERMKISGSGERLKRKVRM